MSLIQGVALGAAQVKGQVTLTVLTNIKYLT